MKNSEKRREQMLKATKKLISNYLFDDICDHETIVSAVAEMLWEDFGVKSAIADNMARQFFDRVWDEVAADVEDEMQEAREYYLTRTHSLNDAREGRW